MRAPTRVDGPPMKKWRLCGRSMGCRPRRWGFETRRCVVDGDDGAWTDMGAPLGRAFLPYLAPPNRNIYIITRTIYEHFPWKHAAGLPRLRGGNPPRSRPRVHAYPGANSHRAEERPALHPHRISRPAGPRIHGRAPHARTHLWLSFPSGGRPEGQAYRRLQGQMHRGESLPGDD